MQRASGSGDRLLRGLLLLYAAASLLHFAHNAEYVEDYPNLPLWITRFSVYGAWLAITAVGILGYVLYRSRWYWSGLLLLGLYAVAGLDGLLHYTLAPIGEHTHAMNFTIGFEVAVAAVLLVQLALVARHVNQRR
jgi:uncharacterized membrane protein